MSEPVSVPQRAYSAFISYSRRDEARAEWLQARLETYRLPRRLAARPTVPALKPDRLAPVFRDRSGLSAAPDLEHALDTALGASGHLVVICTPAAAESGWVNREIEMFHATGRGASILPALFDGDETNAFPPALRRNDVGDAITPLAADFREIGDGPRLALLKLLAELAGVPLGELVGSDDIRRHRRLAAVAGGALAGMTVFAGISAYAFAAKAEAERERAKSEQLVEALVTDLRAAVKPMGSLDLLDKVNEAALGYFGGQSVDDLPDAALGQRTRLLIAMGEDELARGRPALAEVHFAEAQRAASARLATDPDDPDRMFELGQAEYWLGYAAWEGSKPYAAKAHFDRYAQIARSLVARDPDRSDWQMEAGSADINLGMISLRQTGDGAAAERAFLRALGHFRAAAKGMPPDRILVGEIENCLAWLADALRVQGKSEDAKYRRLEQLSLLESELARTPRDMALQSAHISARLALARLDSDAGAAAALERLHADALAFARADLENADAAQQVRAIELFRTQSVLRSGPPFRPPLNEIAASLGECRPTAAALALDELQDFCRLTLARLQLARGNEAAAVSLAEIVQAAARDRPRLSEKWGIDLGQEARTLRTEATGSSPASAR